MNKCGDRMQFDVYACCINTDKEYYNMSRSRFSMHYILYQVCIIKNDYECHVIRNMNRSRVPFGIIEKVESVIRLVRDHYIYIIIDAVYEQVR